MSDTSECRRVVDETIKQLGGIDVIISNAVCRRADDVLRYVDTS